RGVARRPDGPAPRDRAGHPGLGRRSAPARTVSAPIPDLLVVGAGTMGAWTAWHARRAGLTARLVDAFGAGHPRATSGDESRIIRSAHGADRLYPVWARRAGEQWIELGDAVGERLFVEAGVLWFGR